MRKGIRPGEGATREVIAYVLDHGHFAGVPATAMVSLSGKEHRDKFAVSSRPRHRKVGSFQQFVPHEVDCEEMGPSKFPVLVRASINPMKNSRAGAFGCHTNEKVMIFLGTDKTAGAHGLVLMCMDNTVPS